MKNFYTSDIHFVAYLKTIKSISFSEIKQKTDNKRKKIIFVFNKDMTEMYEYQSEYINSEICEYKNYINELKTVINQTGTDSNGE